ncbi:MAG: M28 family peptidase, partial [Candidatus Thermoplasmatota archaeon]|nr:M28 family peptidase [Candidatus Thermoplasmatota archaeon]
MVQPGRSLALALLFMTVPLVGCIGTDAPAEDVQPNQLPDDLLAGITFDGAATVEELVPFVKTFSHRNYDGPEHQGARDYLASEMEDLGLEVIRQGFEDPEDVPFVGDTPVNVHLENIIGIQWGEDRDNWVVVGGHYDTVVAAVEGAYDDGSGTMLTMNLARALADQEFERTIAYVMFDGEERGLKGSRYFSDSVTQFFDEVDAEPLQYQPNITAMINLDMFGINHPAEPPIFFDDNSPEVRDYVLQRAGEIGIPEDKLHCRGITA